MTNQAFECLQEAHRRFEQFAVKQDGKKWTMDDLQKAWTGCGFQTEYKDAWKAGLMEPLRKPVARAMSWWTLTEEGAKIVLQWHKEKEEVKAMV